MVKNTHGGNKSKGFARKNLVKTDTSLRISKEDGEIYAQAIKIMGGKIVSVIDINGNKLTGHIRKKFSGRGKRDNIISPGTWLLVGLHDWETPKTDKPPNCDILEVYTDSDKSRLKNTINSIDWSLFIHNDNKILLGDDTNIKMGNGDHSIDDDCGIIFVDELTQEYEDLIHKQNIDNKKKLSSISTIGGKGIGKIEHKELSKKITSHNYNISDINIDDI
jgi:translation initiation factor IF-1